jgi:hypothetical protein
MSQTNMNCPQCGGQVVFRWAQSVQTTCPYCTSILVRTDVNLELVGQVSSFPNDPSPIQIGTEGVYENKPFVVLGRICYEYDDGGWNEWHIVFNTGESGWLSDAQLQYAITRIVPWDAALDPYINGKHGFNLSPGTVILINNTIYTVATLTKARYRAVEGELPFQYWDKSYCRFVDLRTSDARFMTIDFSEQPALLFDGRAVEFDQLRLTNLRQFEGW